MNLFIICNNSNRIFEFLFFLSYVVEKGGILEESQKEDCLNALKIYSNSNTTNFKQLETDLNVSTWLYNVVYNEQFNVNKNDSIKSLSSIADLNTLSLLRKNTVSLGKRQLNVIVLNNKKMKDLEDFVKEGFNFLHLADSDYLESKFRKNYDSLKKSTVIRHHLNDNTSLLNYSLQFYNTYMKLPF